MGRTWTNKAQLKWLEDRCGAYLKARRDGRLERFFAMTYDAWFELFPTSRISQFCAITPTTVVKWYCNIYYNCSKSPSSRPAMIPSAIMIRHYSVTIGSFIK